MTPPNWTIIFALPNAVYISTHAIALKKEKVREKPQYACDHCTSN
jgi:hypothetical protein